MLSLFQKQRKPLEIQGLSDMEVNMMKGYLTASGYMGFVEDSYMLFASEEEYREFLENDAA